MHLDRLFATAEALLPQIEAEIRASFGTQAGATSALAGRCILASSVLAECLRHHRFAADLVIGSAHIEADGQSALDVGLHAWVRSGKRVLIDPTAVQLERERWSVPICNLASRGLILHGSPHVHLGHQPQRWTLPATPLLITYVPWTDRRPLHVQARRCGDASRERCYPLAAAVLQRRRPPH